MKNIPNILSIIRICLVFVFVVVFFSPLSKIWALVVFLSGEKNTTTKTKTKHILIIDKILGIFFIFTSSFSIIC